MLRTAWHWQPWARLVSRFLRTCSGKPSCFAFSSAALPSIHLSASARISSILLIRAAFSGGALLNAIVGSCFGRDRIFARRTHIAAFVEFRFEIGDPGLGRHQSLPELRSLVLGIAYRPIALLFPDDQICL